MKRYTVEITNEALADMEQLYNHIALKLLAPENAMGQYNRIADEILKLDSWILFQRDIRLWIQSRSIQKKLEECQSIIILCSMSLEGIE